MTEKQKQIGITTEKFKKNRLLLFIIPFLQA